jgi:hypothetical protein
MQMKLTGFIVGVTIVLSACNSSNNNTSVYGADTANKNDGWKYLFDGVTTKGWHTYGQDTIGKAWKVEDSTLHLDASLKGDWQTKNGGDIITDDEFENFDLKLEWKISEGGNSGIIFYANEDTSKYKYAWESGPEMQICDNAKNEDGKVYKSRAGELYELMAISKNVIKPAGEWNAVEIIANNGKLDFNINGEHVLSTTMWDDNWKKLMAGTKFEKMPGFGTFKKGKISLQDHAADIWFRNVKIKEL